MQVSSACIFKAHSPSYISLSFWRSWSAMLHNIALLPSGQRRSAGNEDETVRVRWCLFVLCPWEFPITPWRTILPEVFAWSFLPRKVGSEMMLVTRNSWSVLTVMFQFSRGRLNFFKHFAFIGIYMQFILKCLFSKNCNTNK